MLNRSVQNQLFFRLCSDHLSIEAIPRKPLRIDFKKMKSVALGSYELLMWTPLFVVLRSQGGQEVTLRGDGRMVVRKAVNEELARQTAMDIMNLALRISRDEIIE